MNGYVHSRVQLLCLQTYLIRDLTKKRSRGRYLVFRT